MGAHWPGQRAKVKRDAVKPCVRVDEAVAAKDDEQMMLRRSWHGEQEIAPHCGPRRVEESRPRREGEMAGDAAVSQRITLGRLNLATQSAGDQPHTIHARHRVAPAKPERGPE